MTARGWGSSRQTLRKAENSTAAASPTVPRNSARSTAGSRPFLYCTMLEMKLQVRGQAKAASRDWGSNWCSSSGLSCTKKITSAARPSAAAPGAPVGRIHADLEMDEARSQRCRHAVGNAAVALPVAAGDQRRALGQLVLADLAVEHQLIERRLHHWHRRRQFLEVDEPAAGIVGGRQEGRGRPAGPVGTVAQGMPRKSTGSSRSARTSTYWRPASVATCWAMALLALPGAPQSIVGWRASTRSARVAASSLGRSV